MRTFAACLLLSVLHVAAAAPPCTQAKFLGSAFSAAQSTGFATYWNKVTPENAGKWGSVEATRNVMNWSALDEAYAYAKANGFPIQMHVLIWGNQQPAWIERLPPHVNDSGFWLVSRCLNLTEAQTLRTWTVLSSVASIVGFAAASLVAALI